MDQISKLQENKPSSKKSPGVSVKVDSKTQQELNRLLDKVNKKQYGRKIRGAEVLSVAIRLIDESHIREIQQSSLSNAEKIEAQYKEYIRLNGPISKDDFFGELHKLMINRMAESKYS